MDPFPGMLATPATRHPYLYGLNDPLRFSDPTGLSSDWEEAREILEDSIEFLLGASLQYTNDMTWGLYGEAYRRARGQTLAEVASPAFQRGRQLGRGLSTAVGAVHAAVGTTAVILGLSAGPPTAGAALAAAAPTGGVSIGAGAAVLTVEGLVVVVGAGEAVYGASILLYAERNPLQRSCGPSGPQKGIGGKGWRGDKRWRDAVRKVERGGNTQSFDGVVPTEQEAIDLIAEAGGTPLRTDGPHLHPLSTHQYPHVNYETAGGTRGTIRIK